MRSRDAFFMGLPRMKLGKITLLWVILASLGVSFRAFCEPTVVLDKIVITGFDVEEEKSDSVSPDNTLDIEATPSGMKSAADVVSEVPGVHIQRFGGLESATSISIRGSSHSQVKILLDGVPLETAASEGVGLNQISSSSLGKIEVYKAFSPAELGSQALGGVVNLQSRPIEKGWNQRYGFGFGSFTTFDTLAEVTRGGRRHDFVFGVSVQRTNGDFSFLDNNGTPLNASDDQTVERQNNEQQVVHPWSKWLYRFDGRTRLTITHHFFRIDSGVPGLENFQSQTASRDLTELLSHFKFERDECFRGKIDFSNETYLRWIKSQFSDPNGEIGLGAAQDNDNTTMVFGNRLVGKTKIGENIVLKNGIEYLAEWFSPKDFAAADPVGSTSSRQQINLSVEPYWYFFDKKLLVSAQGQSLHAFYDINDDDPSLATSGSFVSTRQEHPVTGVLSLQYEPVTEILFKTSVGRSVRLPQFLEMFGDQGYVLGNSQLTSEKNIKYDFGVFWNRILPGVFKKIHASTSFFDSFVDDLIQFELASGFARASNIGKARVWGIETSLGAEFLKYFEWAQNYTFQRAKDEAVNDGNFLVGRPEHEWNASLSFKKSGWDLDFKINFIDNQYLDALNTKRVDHRMILNFEAGYLFREKYHLGFSAKNLANSQVVDAVGFPLPGRSFFGRVDVMF